MQSALTDVLYIACHFILWEYWGVAELKPGRYSNPSRGSCRGRDLILELLANILATPAMYKKGWLKAVTMDRPLISSPLCTRLPQPCVTPATIMQTASSPRQWEEKKQQQGRSSLEVIESAYEGNGL